MSPGSQWGHPAPTSHPLQPPLGAFTGTRLQQHMWDMAPVLGHGPSAGPRTGGTPSSPPRPKHHPSPQPSSTTHVPVPVPITRPERQGLTHRGRRPAPILSPAINALDQHRPPAERCRRGHHLTPCTPSTPPVVPSPSPPARRLLARPLTPPASRDQHPSARLGAQGRAQRPQHHGAGWGGHKGTGSGAEAPR